MVRPKINVIFSFKFCNAFPTGKTDPDNMERFVHRSLFRFATRFAKNMSKYLVYSIDKITMPKLAVITAKATHLSVCQVLATHVCGSRHKTTQVFSPFFMSFL